MQERFGVSGCHVGSHGTRLLPVVHFRVMRECIEIFVLHAKISFLEPASPSGWKVMKNDRIQLASIGCCFSERTHETAEVSFLLLLSGRLSRAMTCTVPGFQHDGLSNLNSLVFLPHYRVGMRRNASWVVTWVLNSDIGRAHV